MKSGGAPPQSKTLARNRPFQWGPRLGGPQRSAAL